VLLSTSDDTIKTALARCDNTEQFADVVNTVIEAIDRHVNEIRTQLVLAVLLNEGALISLSSFYSF